MAGSLGLGSFVDVLVYVIVKQIGGLGVEVRKVLAGVEVLLEDISVLCEFGVIHGEVEHIELVLSKIDVAAERMGLQCELGIVRGEVENARSKFWKRHL